MSEWLFLTNHARVLVMITRKPMSTTRELAQGAGITERAVQRLVHELEQAGYLTRERLGRRNRYTVHAEQPLEGSVVGSVLLADLLKGLNVEAGIAADD